jgi:hypothetical protein
MQVTQDILYFQAFNNFFLHTAQEWHSGAVRLLFTHNSFDWVLGLEIASIFYYDNKNKWSNHNSAAV